MATKQMISAVALNEVSYRVSVLHQALDALGLAVNPSETAKNVAGKDTQKKVQSVLRQQHVPVAKGSLLSDAGTSALINVLNQRGLLDSSHAFTVSGTVRGTNGNAAGGVQLIAFDVDLRGAAVYRKAASLAELKKTGGFEFLGQCTSDVDGNYTIKFYDWQYSRAERNKADVVVFAIDGRGSKAQSRKAQDNIIGRSRMVTTADYSVQGQVSSLDVTLTNADTRTEYAALMDALNVFLKESNARFDEVVSNKDQLSFIASELDVAAEQVNIAAAAQRLLNQLNGKFDKQAVHEMLYGIGRQNIVLSPDALHNKTDDELQAAIAMSVTRHIIDEPAKQLLTLLLKMIREHAVQQVLDDNSPRRATLNAMLKNALPATAQRSAFLRAVGTFTGNDYSEFWSTHLPSQPEFKNNKKAIDRLMLTQQLTQISGDNSKLVGALLNEHKVDSIDALFDLDDAAWKKLVDSSGIPDAVTGASDAERAATYIAQMQNMLNAAFPTKRIAQLLRSNKMPVEKSKVARVLNDFLTKTPDFDIASSRISDFEKQLQAIARDSYADARDELCKMQRLFQISPGPDAMQALMAGKAGSATAIAAMPRKNFINTYGDAVGGADVAYAIHQRASHIAARSETTAMRILDYTQNTAPAYALGMEDYTAAITAVTNRIPNYSELFGSPDLCECEECRSVYGAAAYFVDLMRFLWRGDQNDNGQSPLDVLKTRRPDLFYLPLTCENTNTIIPYIDLANEVMEYYAAHDSLASYQGYDTGEATADELRANPQNFNLDAYRNIKDAKYPFSLPYHQPLDTIRTFGDYLKASRHAMLDAANPAPDTTQTRAIAAESLQLSQEEYRVLTGEDFDGTADSTALYQYYGLAAAGDLESLKSVREFMSRSGVAYTDLIEIIKTQFINPYQGALDFLQALFSYGNIDANTLYTKLGQIASGTLDPAGDSGIVAAINAYNAALGMAITPAGLKSWVHDHFAEFQQVVTLYQPDSECDLDTTELRSIQSMYEGSATSGISNTTWSKLHRFIRLWRKLGLTIHETDLLIAALGASDVTPGLIVELDQVLQLQKQTGLNINQLAAFWGAIDTYGDSSLYRKLFLNKSVQQIDTAFAADAWGNYLQDGSAVLADHQSAILAAFRIRDEDLQAILQVARIVDGGTPRAINLNTDILNIGNLSTLYRYALLAKSLTLKVADLCTLVTISNATPFSVWDVQAGGFTSISPQATRDFAKWVAATKSSGFKAAVLQYIVQGTLPADSKIGLDNDKVTGAITAIRDAFDAIEQDHPATAPSPLTADILLAKLSLSFDAQTAGELLGIINGTATFEVMTDHNLLITIPDALADKYSYIKGSGRFTCNGVMTDDEQSALKALSNATANFKQAVDELYTAPETFLADNFTGASGGVFADINEAKRALLDHPKQVTAATSEERMVYVYNHYLPILKTKLRRDAITQHIAALIGLSEAAAAVLIAAQIDHLIDELSTQGFSATYFSDATWTTAVLERVDEAVDFSWDTGAPDATVPADNFSVRWQADISAPASGDYTVVVTVAEADEAFKLYLDDALVVEKAAGDANLSWEAVVTFNAATLQRLKLEYAETANNAGVQLQWKTASSALQVIPSSVAYPAAIVDEFSTLATVLHRAAKFINTFALTDAEVNHYAGYAPDFNNINFSALTVNDWQRVYDYVSLRNDAPQAQASLIDVFVAANVSSPAPILTALKALLCQATAWDAASVDYLVDTHFTLAVNDFRNEIALNKMREVMLLAVRTGLSAQTVTQVGTVETGFDALHATAQLLKNTVKARYSDSDWLSIAGNLSDTLRRNQQQALIAYLLTRPSIQSWGATDADGLFEYFLIDVQMGACMDTSRIVQANSSVQMFVNRCLLNLESNRSSGSETGVSPAAIDPDRWEWMKNYRVWEANRKVFLYPENWLEPDWRTDRSEFFKDMESYLVQNDINPDSVEQAFRNYLSSLNEVANVEVCGLHRENYDDGTLKYLHVFARTHAAPYKYFYRRWNEYRKWSAWEKIPVDIRSVEAGTDSGVQLLPVVWKNRLFLFWPEFTKISTDSGNTGSQSAKDASDKPLSTYAASTYFEIRLGYSEYADDKWSPKKLTKEFTRQYPGTGGFQSEKDLLFTVSPDPKTQQLNITITDAVYNLFRAAFIFDDIQSPVTVSDGYFVEWLNPPASIYSYFYESHTGYGQLTLEDDTYLKTSTSHKLLPVNSQTGLNITLNDPFFFTESKRTYFVRPVDISFIVWVRNPGWHPPYVPGLVDDSNWKIPISIPHLGPDDYYNGKPVVDPLPDYATGDPTYYFGNSAATGMPVMLGGDYAGAMEYPLPSFFSSASMANAGGAMNAGGVNVMTGMMTATPRMRTAMLSSNKTDTKPLNVMSGKSGASALMGKAASGYTKAAFGGVEVIGSWQIGWLQTDTGLEFHTFHHPYAANYVQNLNRGDVELLQASDTTLPSDEGATFESIYQPNFTNGFVQKPADFATRTYYKENVCFDVYGANSLYNWELFFHAPLYIATRLSKNGQYEEAMKWFHYIFDPTTDALPGPGESETSRYWNVLPFKTTPADSLEDWFRSLTANNDPAVENATIAEWRDNPFDPHLVAANRPIAYMKSVVVKYVENLLNWGDSLFRQDTMESVNEALQIYVIANHILGPRPQFVPERGEIKAETYASLQDKWDDFSNALVELENIFPYSSETSVSDSSNGTNLLGVGPALYFCIPPNDQLMGYWDTVADRLYKIRHCQNIDGVFRKLALFAPPIDPGALIQAASQGLSLGSILADLSSPPPIYRFTYLIEKANQFCDDVKALGNALLAALEKKDAEELSLLRATNETQLLNLMTAVKERQVLEAESNQQQLEKARDTAVFKLQHYAGLLGNDSITIPAAPVIAAELTADSTLPADTVIPAITSSADTSLVASGESGVKVIPREQQELLLNLGGQLFHQIATLGESIGGTMNFIPNFSAQVEPFGCGATISYGGSNIAGGISGLAKIPEGIADLLNFGALMAGKMAGYIRREQEWTYQANLAAKEITQIDKQLTTAQIRVQIAQKELDYHQQAIANAQAVEDFLTDKFTNQELYQWMKEQLFATYKQSYNLAYDMAKKTEKAYQYELGTDSTSFIQYGYWDNQKQGLTAGEQLQLALRQLEKSYIDENRRELELVKSISLTRLNPLALVELRETGRCYVNLPEELFDLDFQGHYFRRIRNVRLSIPCIAGPFTSVNCTLRLLNNSIRINTAMNSSGNYEHENDEGAWIDDDRFRVNYVPVTAIATSTAQADPGLFEFNFRDERYLPFEYAGAISQWQIELTADRDLRQFDYSTISDVIMHVGYTAREDVGMFRDKAITYIKNFIGNAAELSEEPLMQFFSMKHDFPNEWYRFLHPANEGGEQLLTFTPARARFPFFAQERIVTVMQLEVFVRSTQSATYNLLMSYTNTDTDTVNSSPITVAPASAYGDVNHTSVDTTDAGMNLEELDVDQPVTFKIKRSTAADYTALTTQPDELDDVMIVLRYHVA